MYMYVHASYIIMQNVVLAVCTQDYVGTSFSLAFPSGLSASAFLRLHITTDSESYVLVTADVPNQSERRLSQGYVRCRTPQVSLSRPFVVLSTPKLILVRCRLPHSFMFVVLPRIQPFFAES